MTSTLAPTIRASDVIRFWVPLCATWLMMSIEGPILTSLVARLPHPDFNLAAYGVAVSVAMFIESPVIMLLSTSVALATDRRAFERLRIFMWRINMLVTAGMVVVCIPSIYDVLAHVVLDLPAPVADRMYWGLVCMIPWPAAIGYRRFYQGLLIRSGLTRRVAWGTVMRLLTMAAAGLGMAALGTVEGIVVGALGLSTGVVFEALATRSMAAGVVQKFRSQADSDCAEAPSYRSILSFYTPLALTSIIGFVVTPMIAFFLGRAPMSIESLAVLPIVDSFVFMFRSFGFSYQEVGIALMGERNRNYPVVRSVGIGIMVATSLALAIACFTPLSEIIFGQLYGLQPHLASFAVLPTQLLGPLPALAVLYSLQRAVLINSRQNVVVTWSTIMEIASIATVLVIVLATTSWPGAVAAALAMVVGRILANGYLWVRTRQALGRG